MIGSSLIQKKKKKRKISRNGYSLSFVVPLVGIRCTPCCHSLYHLLSLHVPFVCLFINVGLCRSAFSTIYLEKLVFRFSVLPVFFLLNQRFWIKIKICVIVLCYFVTVTHKGGRDVECVRKYVDGISQNLQSWALISHILLQCFRSYWS